MRSLAEMVSVRPVKGAIMDYPDVFVDEALGFATGLLYWYGQGAVDVQYTDHWHQGSELYEYGYINHSSCNVHTILGSRLGNSASNICAAFGHVLDECVRSKGKCWLPAQGIGPTKCEKLYGNLEWSFKFFKMFLIVLLCILMIVLKAGGWSRCS